MERPNKNFLMQQLYDMANSPDEEGLSKFDEAKLRREMAGNKNFMAKNKDIFREGEEKFLTCKWYDPCPICEKCRVKGSHLYVRCQNCKIPICVHTHKNIQTLIKRKNFVVKITDPKTIEAFNIMKKEHEERKNG